jgi:hypothetical protein
MRRQRAMSQHLVGVIVNCAVYEDGRRRDGVLDLEDAGEAAKGADGFVWLGVVEPSAREFEAIATEFDLHELAVEDAINAHQRPKVELYGDTLLVVLKTVQYVGPEEVCDFGELLVFVHPTFIITVRHGDGELSEVRRRIERRPDLLGHGVGMVLYAILDYVVDGYEEAAQGVDGDIQAVERQVFSAAGENPAQRLYALERLGPARQRLARQPDPGLGAPERRHAQDLRLGRDPRGADDDRRHLRNELRQHARAALALRLPDRDRRDPHRRHRALHPFQALGLAVAADPRTDRHRGR